MVNNTGLKKINLNELENVAGGFDFGKLDLQEQSYYDQLRKNLDSAFKSGEKNEIDSCNLQMNDFINSMEKKYGF